MTLLPFSNSVPLRKLDTRYLKLINAGDLAFLDVISASFVTDFDTEVSNNTDVAANTSARHTHSNIVALNAVSGVNTGDQTLSGLGGSNTSLSNLASVAINTSLISDTDSTDDLGSSTKYWANAYIDKLTLANAANGDLLVFNTERSWKFTTASSGATTALVLQSTTDNKDFRIANTSGLGQITLRTSTTVGSIILGDATHTGGSIQLYGNTTGANTSLSCALAFADAGEYGLLVDRLRLSSGRFDFDESDGKAEIRVSGGSTTINFYNKSGYFTYLSLNSSRQLTTGSLVLDTGTLRLDQTPAAGTITPTHTFIINLNGTNYKVPVVAA